ncbi:MAG: TetR/AcrR family transcriptional regulator [Stomatobaculum sp.]|nr:TetR/AcrR family transcriptional regulator [Stomatobaculum sp.]
MKGKGLSFEVIVHAALRLVNEKGYGKFSARELASELHVKAASLYNHLDSMDDVNIEIGKLAAKTLNSLLHEAAENRTREEAFTSICRAYRDFVKNNHQLYLAILDLPSLDKGDKVMTETGRESVIAFRNVIDRFDLPEENKVNYTRSIRSLLNGFLQMEMAGYFSSTKVKMEDSFDFIIAQQLLLLQEAEKEYRKDQKSRKKGAKQEKQKD